MTEPTSSEITLSSAEVRRLISIAARWSLLSRLAGEVNAMCDARWEHLLMRTRDDTLIAVQKLMNLVHTAAPDSLTVTHRREVRGVRSNGVFR